MNLPQFQSYQEVEKFVLWAWANKYLRPGQAVANKFRLDKKLEDQIYEEKDLKKVCSKIWNYTNNRF